METLCARLKPWREPARHAGLLWLRVLMGLGIARHGWGKVFGGHMDRFAEGVAAMGFPLPGFFAWSAGLSELLGGMLIAVGLATRPAACFVFATMFVAAFIRHGADPFARKELALAYLVMAAAVLLMGGGRFSLDSWLCGRFCDQK